MNFCVMRISHARDRSRCSSDVVIEKLAARLPVGARAERALAAVFSRKERADERRPRAVDPGDGQVVVAKQPLQLVRRRRLARAAPAVRSR